MSVEIREATFADYDGMRAFWLGLEGVLLNDADTPEAIDRYLKRNPGMSFVALDNGKIVGTALSGHDGRRGYIVHFAVAKEHRGSGLAARLLDSCCESLKSEGINRVFGYVLPTNERMLKLAELRGWKEIEFRLVSKWLITEPAV
jgi:N-acetylglutamate synthase